MGKGQQILEPVVDVILSLWRRSDRDFTTKSARNAFRETCIAMLKGDVPEVIEVPSDETPRDSSLWAKYIAFSDYSGLGQLLDGVSEMIDESFRQELLYASDDSDSDVESIGDIIPVAYRIKRRRRKRLNPYTDRRFKANKNKEELDKQRKDLAYARVKANEVYEATQGIGSQNLPPDDDVSVDEMDAPGTENMPAPEDSSSSDDETPIEYVPKRERNSRPQKVPLPKLPTDYRLENEWIKKNIKTPDMLYSYVRAKAGDGVRWSSGLRKYFENYDFWEFAFDTLSSGGWHDSEFNRPICNVSKYITKATIEEFTRHEATKHSRFEGKFTTGKELLDYVKLHCMGMSDEYKTEAYCEWFLQKMNDRGWRWNDGSTINNLPGQMAKSYREFKEWQSENKDSLAGLNASQIGDTFRVHKAIESGEWKPRANGKFSALDLKKFL